MNVWTAYLKSPLSMNTAPLFRWNAAAGAAVAFGIGTVVGEPLFVGVGLGMNGGVMFGVGLGTAICLGWLSSAGSPELVSVTTTLTMMAINRAADVPASHADLEIPENVPLPGVGPVPSGPGSGANSSTQPKGSLS